MRRSLAVLASAVFAALMLAPAVSVSAATGGPFSGKVLFADTFTGVKGALPTPGAWTDYSACSYSSIAAFGDIQCGDNEKLDGAGNLAVTATPTTGSGIRVALAHAYEYGVWSAWIKAPAQAGYWPAFWTLNNGYDGTNHALLGEADAYEGYTQYPTQYWATEHNWTNDGTPSSELGTECPAAAGGANLSAAFHKYSVEIAPNAVSFYLDGKACGPTITPARNPGDEWGFGPTVTAPNWMILDLAVGGCGGCQAAPTANATMLVSRVEVRKLP